MSYFLEDHDFGGPYDHDLSVRGTARRLQEAEEDLASYKSEVRKAFHPILRHILGGQKTKSRIMFELDVEDFACLCGINIKSFSPFEVEAL